MCTCIFVAASKSDAYKLQPVLWPLMASHDGNEASTHTVDIYCINCSIQVILTCKLCDVFGNTFPVKTDQEQLPCK